MSDRPKSGDRVRFTIQGTLQPYVNNDHGEVLSYRIEDEKTFSSFTFSTDEFSKLQDFEIIEPEWKVGMTVVIADQKYNTSTIIYRIIALHGKYAWIQADTQAPVSTHTHYIRRYIE